jgi:hypothetical protein
MLTRLAAIGAIACALTAPAGAQTVRTEAHASRLVTVVGGLDHP